MMLLNFAVRLLVIAAISAQWVVPAVCMDNNLQIVNSPDKDGAAISPTDKNTTEENIDPEALPSAVVNSKVIPRSPIDSKELLKIFNIAYSFNESRVSQRPLNHYELPDDELVKRGFRNDKTDNVAAESKVIEVSPVPWVTNNSQSVENNETITNVHVNEERAHTNDNMLSELMFQVGKITNAMVDTIHFSASNLKKQLETLGSQVLEIGNTMDIDFTILFIITGCFVLSIISYIIYKIYLTLPLTREDFDCEEGKNTKTMRRVFLSIYLENDNFISHIDVLENEDKISNENKKNDEVKCVYTSPGASINEILQEALKM